MKKSKRLLALVLAVISVISIFTLTVFAADTSYSKYDTPESSGDYAYWNGKKVVKSGSTNTSEIKWMQASMNYLISVGYISGSYLTVDGSFGPASKAMCIKFQAKTGLSKDGSFGPGTIQKMKDVLNKKPWEKTTTTTSSNSEITTDAIKKVLNSYGYETDKYWTYKAGGNPTSSYVATTRKGKAYSYNYNGVQCYGFANFVMHIVTGKNVNPNNGNKDGWKYIKASDVTELKVGDIVRIGKSNNDGHSGIVYTKDSKGNCTFAQCYGGSNNKISIGTSLNSSYYGSHSTLSSMKNKGVLLYVYRYVG